jgi:hypothetical protein
MFDTNHATSLFTLSSRERALETWRDAASLVAFRWRVFLDADAASRRGAFAAYIAALDAEEAAAADMQILSDLAA